MVPNRKQVYMETDIDRRMVLVHNIGARIQTVKENKAYDDLPVLMCELDAAMTDTLPPDYPPYL